MLAATIARHAGRPNGGWHSHGRLTYLGYTIKDASVTGGRQRTRGDHTLAGLGPSHPSTAEPILYSFSLSHETIFPKFFKRIYKRIIY
jgi:hypothetical protein